MEEVRPRAELEQVVAGINKDLGLQGMHIEMSSDKRANEVLEFFRKYFIPYETMSISLDFKDIDEETGQLVLMELADHLSLLLVDDATDKVIGMRTLAMFKKDDPSVLDMIKDEKPRKMAAFVEHLYKDMDVFRYFKVDAAIHFIALCVHPDYRNKGLASKLMDAAITYCQQLGPKTPCAVVEATSIYSQKIFTKLGFDVLTTVKFEDYKVNGEVVFKNTGNTKTAIVYAKKLC